MYLFIECCCSHSAQAQSPLVGTTWAWKVFFCRFLLRLCRIKRPQVMSRVKFGPTQHSILVMILFYKCIFLGHPPQEILLYFHTENSRTHSLHSTGVRAVIFGLQKSKGQFEEKTERCSYSKIFVNIYLPQR